MKDISEILKNKSFTADHRNKYEYQAYGNRLADELGDSAHRSLYIKMAKTEDRNLMDAAREFVMRSESATTKGKLFMWKLGELKKLVKEKEKEKKPPETVH